MRSTSTAQLTPRSITPKMALPQTTVSELAPRDSPAYVVSVRGGSTEQGVETSRGKRSLSLRPPVSLSELRPGLGVVLVCGGVGGFLIGASSSKWVLLHSKEDYGTGVTADFTYPDRHSSLLAHVGPWLACNHADHCDKPWILAAGLAEDSVRGTEFMFTLAMLFYLVSAAAILLRVFQPSWLPVRLRYLLTYSLPRLFLPIAAVLALLSMLMMGELKRHLILDYSQKCGPGWPLAVSLLAVLATLAGGLCLLDARPEDYHTLQADSYSPRQPQLELAKARPQTGGKLGENGSSRDGDAGGVPPSQTLPADLKVTSPAQVVGSSDRLGSDIKRGEATGYDSYAGGDYLTLHKARYDQAHETPDAAIGERFDTELCEVVGETGSNRRGEGGIAFTPISELYVLEPAELSYMMEKSLVRSARYSPSIARPRPRPSGLPRLGRRDAEHRFAGENSDPSLDSPGVKTINTAGIVPSRLPGDEHSEGNAGLGLSSTQNTIQTSAIASAHIQCQGETTGAVIYKTGQVFI